MAGTLIELLAAVVIGYHVIDAVSCILRRQGSDKARLIIAEGVLSALGFMVAGTLLTTLALESWVQIRTFAVILTMRTLLKRVFTLEKAAIEARSTWQTPRQ